MRDRKRLVQIHLNDQKMCKRRGARIGLELEHHMLVQCKDGPQKIASMLKTMPSRKMSTRETEDKAGCLYLNVESYLKKGVQTDKIECDEVSGF